MRRSRPRKRRRRCGAAEACVCNVLRRGSCSGVLNPFHARWAPAARRQFGWPRHKAGGERNRERRLPQRKCGRGLQSHPDAGRREVCCERCPPRATGLLPRNRSNIHGVGRKQKGKQAGCGQNHVTKTSLGRRFPLGTSSEACRNHEQSSLSTFGTKSAKSARVQRSLVIVGPNVATISARAAKMRLGPSFSCFGACLFGFCAKKRFPLLRLSWRRSPPPA